MSNPTEPHIPHEDAPGRSSDQPHSVERPHPAPFHDAYGYPAGSDVSNNPKNAYGFAPAPPYATPIGIGEPTLRATARGRTDGFAIAALVLGILGSSVLSITFGFIGLSRIKKSGRDGRGMAIAGLILGGLWLVVAGVLIAVGATNLGHTRDTVSTMPRSVGQCFDLTDEAQPSKARFKPCEEPHRWEVYAVHELPAGTYPGRGTLVKQGSDLCGSSITEYFAIDVDLNTIGIEPFVPTQAGWRAGNRNIVCIADNLDHTPRTGSLAGSHT